jgi:hypothetical protein
MVENMLRCPNRMLYIAACMVHCNFFTQFLDFLVGGQTDILSSFYASSLGIIKANDLLSSRPRKAPICDKYLTNILYVERQGVVSLTFIADILRKST